MREYSSKISLTQNDRGIYSLDTTIGCASGTKENKNGCYNDCYAAKSAKLYGYDFTKTVLRKFENKAHERKILREINNIKLPFVRIGTSGDPSENWEHTFDVLNVISKSNKEIVIITKHWFNMNENQLNSLKKMNVCINTSVSALDKIDLLNNSINQYNIIKNYCKSSLRVVSFDFNKENELGLQYDLIQNSIFNNENILDTVFRTSKRNPIVKNGIINVKESKFLGKKALISKRNKKTYFGKCVTCKEMCGVNLEYKNIDNSIRRQLTTQLTLL